MRPLAVLIAAQALALSPTLRGAETAAARFSDPVHGFEVSVPELGNAAGAVLIQRLAVAGAPEGGFAPNCNVQVQFVAMSLDAFLDLSVRQFEAMELEVHATKKREVSGRPAATFEYGGTMQGEALRFLALAVSGQDRVWLVTCTATQTSFEKHRAAFVRVIDSFALLGAAKRS